MPAEETALRFIRAAVAAQSHKNGSFDPFLWTSAIVTMRIPTGAPQHSRGRCKVFGQFRPKTLHRNKAASLGFQGLQLCSVRIKIRYFHGNRRALRVGVSYKNPTRRWRYQNKTIVLFFMDSSMIARSTSGFYETGVYPARRACAERAGFHKDRISLEICIL